MKRRTLLVLLIVGLLSAWLFSVSAFAVTPTPPAPQPGFFGASALDLGDGPPNASPNQPQGGFVRPVAPVGVGGPTPTPVIPKLDWDPTAVYQIKQERTIGAYVIRAWQNINSENLIGFDGIVTIQATGQPLVQIDMASGWHELTGTDITGEGNPDVVIETFSGGAHCCFSTIVYDLGPTLAEVLRTPESNCGGTFQDEDYDGVLEFITCDDGFAYQYCCYAASPAVKVILKYFPGEGYLPASTSFPYLYAGDIADHKAAAEKAAPGDFCEWDETTKCAVLPVVLDYLYSGQPDMAWSELARLYPYPDREQFKREILEGVSASPLYVFP